MKNNKLYDNFFVNDQYSWQCNEVDLVHLTVPNLPDLIRELKHKHRPQDTKLFQFLLFYILFYILLLFLLINKRTLPKIKTLQFYKFRFAFKVICNLNKHLKILILLYSFSFQSYLTIFDRPNQLAYKIFWVCAHCQPNHEGKQTQFYFIISWSIMIIKSAILTIYFNLMNVYICFLLSCIYL